MRTSAGTKLLAGLVLTLGLVGSADARRFIDSGLDELIVQLPKPIVYDPK